MTIRSLKRKPRMKTKGPRKVIKPLIFLTFFFFLRSQDVLDTEVFFRSTGNSSDWNVSFACSVSHYNPGLALSRKHGPTKQFQNHLVPSIVSTPDPTF